MSLAFLVMLALIVFFFLAGLPIGIGLIAGSIWYLILTGNDLGLAAEQISNGLYTNFVILAVPMFIFASRVASAGSLMDRLVDFAASVVGWWQGGLAHVNVMASLILSGMSGSAVADAAGIGRLQIEMMTRRRHYTEAYSAAITATSAVIGPIIPPSIPMVLYALVSDASLGALFLGGVLPGLIMAGALMLAVWFTAKRKGFPVDEPFTLRRFFQTMTRAFLPLLTPVILLGGIYSGAFTPTEAAGVASAYALALTGLVYRELSLKDVYTIFLDSLRDSTAVLMIVVGSFLLNYIITIERIPQLLLAFLSGLNLSPLGFTLLINAVFLVLGMFLDASVLLLVAVPLVLPLVKAVGINLVYFGVVIVLNIMIGLVTPPFGVLLFIVKGLVTAPMTEIIRESLPFLVVLVVSLLLVVFFPQLVLWLPREVLWR